MKLSKYYLDAVGANGDGCICYSAQLDGFGLGAQAGGTLAWTSDAAKAPAQRRTLRCRQPEQGLRGTTWRCGALGAVGCWEGTDYAVPEVTLWEGKAGSVRWQAFAPCARARVRIGAQVVSGQGYAERLDLDAPLWKIPIETLLWGRFASRGHSVIWIDWGHGASRRWLWHNGKRAEPKSIGAQGIAWDGWSLAFDDRRPLRSGRISDTVLARWPALGLLLPPEVKGLDEAKFLARGTLSYRGRPEASGFVIHERVRFR